jgi:general secretion pathway protein B
MSYILDALRKSEQQRQAVQPETVADRILLNTPQPKQKLAKWLVALVVGNLLVVAYLGWFFNKKDSVEAQNSTKIASNPNNKLLPTTSEKSTVQPTVIAQDKISQATGQSAIDQAKPPLTSPSIAELVEAKKMAASQRLNTRPITEKKPIVVKKELATRTIETQPIKRETLRPDEENLTIPPVNKSTPDLKELSYETRNNLPNLTINVFSYAQRPEDRFVIIDMVKYKTGQLIKGSVKLKEIRPDGIVVQDGNNTFKVERP